MIYSIWNVHFLFKYKSLIVFAAEMSNSTGDSDSKSVQLCRRLVVRVNCIIGNHNRIYDGRASHR